MSVRVAEREVWQEVERGGGVAELVVGWEAGEVVVGVAERVAEQYTSLCYQRGGAQEAEVGGEGCWEPRGEAVGLGGWSEHRG